MTHTILVVDDEIRLADVLTVALSDLGYQAIAAHTATEALEILKTEHIDLVLTDLRMPGMDGRQLLNQIRKNHPTIPVVMITAFASVRDAVELIKEGAFDYIAKPFEIEDVAATVHRALRLNEVVKDNVRLRTELEGRYRFDQLIGTSAPFCRVIEQVSEVCESRATVLLTGESGTGKEVVARAIHFNSPRSKRPFVAVNCAAIPEGLLESELFGHVKGAFTGAISNREGRFAQADGGTLLLDEIGDMPIAIQAKILRVLQERTFEPVGSTKTIQTDVRVIAATHKDLKLAVSNGTFREDLYYRLNVFPIELPALRERKQDVPLIANYFLKQFNESMGKRIIDFSEAAQTAMQNYNWPGNIRELQNCVERAVIVARGTSIDLANLPRYVLEGSNSTPIQTSQLPSDIDEELARQERNYLLKALEESEGVQTKAAQMLGISERSFWHRVKKHDIKIVKRMGE
jgi:two-component system, NtrC family, response regulator AtoC